MFEPLIPVRTPKPTDPQGEVVIPHQSVLRLPGRRADAGGGNPARKTARSLPKACTTQAQHPYGISARSRSIQPPIRNRFKCRPFSRQRGCPVAFRRNSTSAPWMTRWRTRRKIADEVMRLPARRPPLVATPRRPGRTCATCEGRADMLQRGPAAMSGGATIEAPGIVREALRSPGQVLDTTTRAYFEPRFGRDFSGVRVHTDSRAAASARRLNARAYTLGQDVVFDAGQFAPETQEGRRLLAHELAHVVQQTREDSTGSAGGCHGKCEGPANSPNAAERHIRVQRRMNAACHDDLGREVHIGRESLFINTIIGAHWKGLDTAHNRAEFTIPRSGQNSGTGRADLVAVHPSQIQVYEVKPRAASTPRRGTSSKIYPRRTALL